MAHQPAKPQIHAYSLKVFTIIVLALLLNSFQSLGQPLPARDARLLAKAETHFDKREYDKAVPVFQQFLVKHPQHGHTWMLLGEAAMEIDDTQLAFNAFSRALAIDSLRFVRAWAILGELHLNKGQYQEAADSFERALKSKGFRDNELPMLIKRLEVSKLRQKLVANPYPVSLLNLGPPLNTSDDEIPNSILLDGSQLLFTRKQAGEGRGGRPASETFLVVQQTSQGWTAPSEFVAWQSAEYNMGAPVISPDGNTLWFAGCGWPDGFGSCDIYVSELRNGQWSLPLNLGRQLNSSAWDAQPAISADGQTLIFSSNRPGGLGGSDLYRSVRLPDGQWSRPENLGPVINSSGNEMAPFFHPDGSTLYFSSDGHPGMGGYDLFMSRTDETGRWTSPVNLGVPINSADDEINIITDATGHNAWMAAKRPDGFGGYDIYTFVLPAELKPLPLRTVKILVTGADNGKPLQALIRVNSLSDGSLLFEGRSRDTDGQVSFPLPREAQFTIFAGAEQYVYFSEHYTFPAEADSLQLVIEVKLLPAAVGQSLVLNNIYFDFNSADLLAESYPALRHLADFLRQNPEVQIEIAGHTDNIGSSGFNQRLSLQRAESVRSWLIQQGIAPDRLKARGYGADVPLASNDDETGRAKNRRTEIKVLRRE